MDNLIFKFEFANLDRELLFKEALIIDKFKPYYDKKTDSNMSDWVMNKDVGAHGEEICEHFKSSLSLKTVRPYMFIQQPGFTLGYHKDRLLRCAINFVLSDQAAPVRFQTGDVHYKTALLNVEEPHAVPAFHLPRYLFKLCIVEEPFIEVRERLKEYLK